MPERLNKVATLFPNESSCLRLVSAVAMGISDEWETDRIYLTMEQQYRGKDKRIYRTGGVTLSSGTRPPTRG